VAGCFRNKPAAAVAGCCAGHFQNSLVVVAVDCCTGYFQNFHAGGDCCAGGVLQLPASVDCSIGLEAAGTLVHPGKDPDCRHSPGWGLGQVSGCRNLD